MRRAGAEALTAGRSRAALRLPRVDSILASTSCEVKAHSLTALRRSAGGDPDAMPVAVTSITERREPNAQVAYGEAVQVPGAAARDLLGLGSEKAGELPLEAQPRVLLDDAFADRVGYLAAA